MLKFSIKNAFRKKSTALLASIGVGVGLMLVFVISAFTAGVTAQFQNNLAETIGIVEVVEKDVDTRTDSHLPLDLPNKLYNTPEVGEFISKYNVEVQAPILYTSNYSGEAKLRITGDFLSLKALNRTIDESWGGPTSKIIQGRVFEPESNEIIIDSRLLTDAKFSIDLGETLEIKLDPVNTSSLTIVGVYQQDDIGAPPFVPKEYYIYTDLLTLWNLFNASGIESNTYTAIELLFDVSTSEETNLFVDRINSYSDGGGYSPLYVIAISLAAFFENFEETFALFDGFAAIIGFITVLAGGMAIIVTQLMSVTSRMKEFAILKATGWKNRHIFLNVIYESLTLGLLGALIGMGIGSLLIYLLSFGGSPFGGASATITIDGIIEVVAYALGLGIIGGLYPGIKAARVRPVIVLKGE
jgi:putative ABC transport system permease protein